MNLFREKKRQKSALKWSPKKHLEGKMRTDISLSNQPLRFTWNQFDQSFLKLISRKMLLPVNCTQQRNFGNSISHLWQKFRESNGFVIQELIWRDIILVRENFSFFHTVLHTHTHKKWKIQYHWKIFREMNLQ